jgi:hypothetical protein
MEAKRLRLTVDVTFELEDINEEAVRRDFQYSSHSEEILNDPTRWEDAARQQRLFEALRQHPEVLRKFLIRTVIDDYLDSSSEDNNAYYEKFGVEGSTEELFKPVIESLSLEDANHFRVGIAHDLFYEYTEHIWRRLMEKSSEVSLTNYDLPLLCPSCPVLDRASIEILGAMRASRSFNFSSI